jgi:hypothetical protein
MPLIRGHHSFDDHFTQIPNAWLRDNRLSFKSRGILSLIMSHREGWSLSIQSLADQNLEGKDAIRSAIEELEIAGYLTRAQVNEGGRFGESIWMTKDPADLPMTENPMTENPTPKKNIIKEQHLKNTKEEAGEFETFWKLYPRHDGKSEAQKAYVKALRKIKHSDLMDALEKYIGHNTKHSIIFAHASTWLNQERWTDEYDVLAVKVREKAKAVSDEYLAELREREKLAAPAPKCPHGENVALCRSCL